MLLNFVRDSREVLKMLSAGAFVSGLFDSENISCDAVLLGIFFLLCVVALAELSASLNHGGAE